MISSLGTSSGVAIETPPGTLPGLRFVDIYGLTSQSMGLECQSSMTASMDTQPWTMCSGCHCRLRSPKAPDNMADMETHTFTYAFMAHHGSFQEADVNKHAYCLNNPLIVQQQHEDKTPATLSVFKMSSNQVVLETVKKSEDDKALILRFYESFGGMCTVTMTTMLKFKLVQVVNGLEEDMNMWPGLNLTRSDGSVHFTLRAFQIISLKLLL
ncbi:alpha-mannosidase 2C1-like isoform X2 [Dreissena polymorpha]|uniref:alpha-mannosidase 2C1-like isoform X2 n=1 Tax=Dreissena polymorpha TaxID=45954 RepID=UPI0022643A5D|nr:alpha-mannosidase 2C1-like isoform X2 [Dreissena polymorpha]XP_052239066.1 alpha-mannosidase 2C1-like isoform X2 [Dreissena polymorpha]